MWRLYQATTAHVVSHENCKLEGCLSLCLLVCCVARPFQQCLRVSEAEASRDGEVSRPSFMSSRAANCCVANLWLSVCIARVQTCFAVICHIAGSSQKTKSKFSLVTWTIWTRRSWKMTAWMILCSTNLHVLSTALRRDLFV